MKPSNEEDNTIRLKAMLVIGTEWSRTYKEAAYQGEDSLNAINSFNITVTSDGVLKSGEVYSDMMAVPIRLCGEGEERNLGVDWCQNRSPIDAIHCGVIPRWFPWDWIYNNKTDTPEFVDIDLGEMPTTGEHIVLACEVTKVASDQKNYFFCNIISDDDLKKYETRKLNHENKSGSAEGATMFFKKKNVTESAPVVVQKQEEPATVVVEEKKEEVVEPVINENVQDNEQINVEKVSDDSNVVETPELKNIIEGGQKMAEEKEINTKPHTLSEKAKKALKPTLWFLGGTAFGAAVTLIVTKVVAKKNAGDCADVPAVEETAE